jgi:Family of unknown function (DUF6221)
MSVTDLHTRLTAAITARLDVARAATPGPWRSYRTLGEQKCTVRFAASPYTAVVRDTPNDEDAIHIASWDPTTAIRVLEALQEVVARHRLCPADCKHHVGRLWCHAVACFVNSERWPCADIRSAARALGVEVE